MRPAFSRAHGKLENFRVVETRRDVTTFSLETLRVANHLKMVFPEAVKPKIEQGGWLALVSVQDVLVAVKNIEVHR